VGVVALPVRPTAHHGRLAVVDQRHAVEDDEDDTVVEVRASLRPKSATPSGFEWSTSEGPPFKIGGGTLVSINIVVDRKAPITMVMPFLRKTFGVA